MRLAAQIRGGFYPAAPEVVRLFARKLVIPDGSNPLILDPCCGKGEAIRIIAETTCCPLDNAYAIELDEGRTEEARAALPGSTLLAPADFLSAAISSGWCSFAWVNPPFDDEIGGGRRVEASFASRASQLLVAGGVLALVMPESVIRQNRDINAHMMRWYDDIAILPFPEEHRPYGEVIVVGKKRKRARETDSVSPRVKRGSVDDDMQWTLPSSPGRPKTFAKGGPTEAELLLLLEQSPLRIHAEPPPASRRARPPIPISSGHVSLMLSCGHLDGLVTPDGEPPHVVRGIARKEKYVAERSDDGETATTVLKERMVPVLRAVDETGEIKTFEQGAAS